jgi:hypothetical protein
VTIAPDSVDAVRDALERGFHHRLSEIPAHLLSSLWPEQAEQLGARAAVAAVAPRMWANVAGDRLATADLVQALGVSRQALAKRVANGTLLGLPGRGTTLYPTWQFEVTADTVRVRRPVAEAFAAWVEEAGALDPYAVIAWAQTRQPELDDLTPLQYLGKDVAEDDRVTISARVTAARLAQ